MSSTESLPLHPAQQQKFWNEERIEMAMVSTALDLAATQVQMQEEYFPTPIPSPVPSPSGSYTDTPYYCTTELQALSQAGLDHQHLSPVPVSQYPTGPSSPPDSGIYCQSPYRSDSYSPSPHGSPAAVTTTANHFSPQQNYPYVYPTVSTASTFGLGESTSVIPLVTPFDDLGKYNTISLGSGCYLQAFMQQNCMPQLASFDNGFQACMSQCSTATSPIPRSSSLSSIESDAHQIQMFDTNKQQLLGDTLEFYPPTPPSPESPEARCCPLEFVAYPHMHGHMAPAPLPPHLKTPPRVTKPKGSRKPPKPPVQVDDSDIKDIPTSAQLWEFTLRVLCKPKYSYMVSWENQKEGLFRFHDAPAFAALWGKHRNRPSMTYDKVARALRYYYKRDIFNQVGGRLTYRFSKRLSKLYAPE